MTYFGARLREALNNPEHRAMKPDAHISRNSRNHLVIRYRSFDAFLDAQASKRMVR